MEETKKSYLNERKVTRLFVSCAGEHVDPHQLLDILGCAAGLQPVLWTRDLWPGYGHHADWGPRILCGRLVEGQTQMGLQGSRWVGPGHCTAHIQMICKTTQICSQLVSVIQTPHVVSCVAERVTYMGQKLCYVVFPQEDSAETEPLTASKATDWAVQSTRNSPHQHINTSTPALPVFATRCLVSLWMVKRCFRSWSCTGPAWVRLRWSASTNRAGYS